MIETEQLQQDLDYVRAAVHRGEQPAGIPVLYLFWAAVLLIGFASADFAPRLMMPFWIVVGVGGGLFSWWIGARDERRRGVRDVALGRRYSLHWAIGGVGYFLTALPIIVHGPNESVAGFLLTTGIVYGLAGVHLERPLLWCGLLAFAGYAALVALALPYAWTLTGALMAACLVLAAAFAARARAPAR